MQCAVKLTVCIPAYKEGENLTVLLPRLVNTLYEVEPQYEVLVVDTLAPMDNTKTVCEAMGSNIVYTNRRCGNNFGDAVRTGIELARGEYFISIDGDGSHDPEFIKKLYAKKNMGDVVVASRYIDGGATENSKALIFMSRVVNMVYSKILNLDCKDVSNSFKLYRSEDLKKLKLRSNNFDIVEEILFRLKKANKNLVILELPFTFKARMFGETKRNLLVFMITYLFTLIKLRLSR